MPQDRWKWVVSRCGDEPQFSPSRVFIECLCTSSSFGKCDTAENKPDKELLLTQRNKPEREQILIKTNT